MLNVKTFKGGYDDNFSYLIYNFNEAAIIDTSINPEILFRFAKENNLQIKFAVIMHSHFDHIVDLDYYRKKGIQLIASKHSKIEVDKKVTDGDILKVGDHELKIIYTPGHIYDSICILVEDKLFTSDTLFIDSCGRVDLPGADPKQMGESLKKIKQFPNNTIIYPGHDYGNKETSLLSEQKITNRYLK